jgi:ATP-binding cassette subfamily F protein uup
LPALIQRLEAEQLDLQAAIGDPQLFTQDPPRGAAALQRLQALEAEMQSAYERWVALESS